jgi:hypothetical protein
VPSFLEACARLAGDAAAHGDFDRARVLIEKAARVAALEDADAACGVSGGSALDPASTGRRGGTEERGWRSPAGTSTSVNVEE